MKIKVTLGIGFAGAEHVDVIDVNDVEYNECETEEQRHDLLCDYWNDWSGNYIDGGWEVIHD